MTITLQNPTNDHTIVAPTGFSWTTLFFGPFPALLRGDALMGLVMLAVAFVTAGLSWFVFPFFYNNLFINSKLEKGYKKL